MILMKRILLILAAAALSSCVLLNMNYQIGNGVSAETTLEIGEFDSISSCCSLDLIYTQKEGAQSVVLTCDENLVEYYDIRVEDGTLIIDTKRGTSINTKVKSYLTVTSPRLDYLKLSGSGDCEITSAITTDGDFNFKVSGSGDIEADGSVICKNFYSSVSGSGNIDVVGVQAESAEFKDSGSGDIEVDSITAEDITIKMSGSGDIALICKNAGYINASLSGSGDLILSGSALSVQSNITGSGRVQSNELTIIRQ